ncbi:AAA family ATPase [Candidatus Woesearchaeota archaeon]|nr:AAA family ATPase [Candidatus Woesearchaeota archaeon]
MALFKDILAADQTLIKNESALEYEFVPKILPHREKEQQYLATCIKPLLQQRNGRNLLIHGPPGIGKTAATKWVIRDLEEETDELYVIYINCWQYNSTYKIVCEICNQIGYKFIQNKKTTDLYDIIANIINKNAGVFVFDEVDKVEDFDFLYFLLEKIYKKTIFLITNFKSWLLELDERIKSRLTPELVEFKAYNQSEVDSILKERVETAFFEKVWKTEAFKKISKRAGEIGDIRSGIYLLKQSALSAEDRSSKTIEVEDAESALKKIDDFTIKNSADLEDETKFILKVVKDNSGKKIGDLFKQYQKEGGKMSYKTFQRKLAHLDQNKFVTLKKQTGAGGNTTIVEKKLTDF